jgi:hypothetical protein
MCLSKVEYIWKEEGRYSVGLKQLGSNFMVCTIFINGELSRYSDWLRAGQSGYRISVGTRFFAHVQTGPGAHPASCTMGTGSFPGVKLPGRGADHPLPPSAEVENE